MGKVDHSIEIEALKGSGCEHHRIDEEFKYPEEIGEMCPWLFKD
jgi:hypothetical protein